MLECNLKYAPNKKNYTLFNEVVLQTAKIPMVEFSTARTTSQEFSIILKSQPFLNCILLNKQLLSSLLFILIYFKLTNN